MCPIDTWWVINTFYTLVLSLHKRTWQLMHWRWSLWSLSFCSDPSQFTWKLWWHVDPRYSCMVECVSWIISYFVDISHVFVAQGIFLGLIQKVIVMMKTAHLPYIADIIQAKQGAQKAASSSGQEAGGNQCIRKMDFVLRCPSTAQDALETQRHQRHKAVQVSLKRFQSKVKNVDFPRASWGILGHSRTS